MAENDGKPLSEDGEGVRHRYLPFDVPTYSLINMSFILTRQENDAS